MAVSEMMITDSQEGLPVRGVNQCGATAMAGKMCAGRLGMPAFLRELLKMTKHMRQGVRGMNKCGATAMAGKTCAGRLGMPTFVRELLQMTKDMEQERGTMTKMADTC